MELIPRLFLATAAFPSPWKSLLLTDSYIPHDNWDDRHKTHQNYHEQSNDEYSYQKQFVWNMTVRRNFCTKPKSRKQLVTEQNTNNQPTINSLITYIHTNVPRHHISLLINYSCLISPTSKHIIEYHITCHNPQWSLRQNAGHAHTGLDYWDRCSAATEVIADHHLTQWNPPQ